MKRENNLGNELVKGKYILQSSLEWRFLWELATQCNRLTADMPLVITPNGVRFVVRDEAQIVQCEMRIGKEAFSFYEASENIVTLDSAELVKILSRNGKSGDILGFMIEPDRAYLCHEDDEFDIPIIDEIGTGYMPSQAPIASVTVPREFLLNVMKAMETEKSAGIDNDLCVVGIGPQGLRIMKGEGGVEVGWVVAGG